MILLMWVFLTSVNINKAIHSDDAFHLKAAQHILKDPLRPMTGTIRWDELEPTPIYVANQPPGLFYMIAGVSLIFGFNEIAFHLLISVFSFLALFWFYKLACLVEVQRPLLTLALFGFCPALLVNQNVHTDVPLLALIIGSLYYLLLVQKTKKAKYNLIAILLVTAAIFLKYTALAFLGAIALIFILRKEYKNLWFFMIPIGLIVLWSLWNQWEYGGVHILDRKIGARSTLSERAWAYVTTLGSIAPFGVISLAYFLKKNLSLFIVYVSAGLLVVISIFYYFSPAAYGSGMTPYLEILFFINGAIILISTFTIVYRKFFRPFSLATVVDSLYMPVVVYFGAILIFLILFAPFMGTRHVLLSIPFILLLADAAVSKCNTQLLGFSVVASFVLSLLLGISDWKYADFYRNAAQGIMRGMPPGSKVWATGTSGWTWYAGESGMIEHTLETATPKPGDYLVIPSKLWASKVSSKDPFTVIAKIWGEVTPLNYVAVSGDAGLYYSKFGRPSWTLSRKPIDTVFVCQFVDKK